MAMDPDTAARIVAELQPLIGGRVQRADVIAPHEVVLEIRCPGRTLRLLAAAHPVLGRVHLIERRPPKTEHPADLQAVLRKRLVGRPLAAIAAAPGERTVTIDVPDARLMVRLGGGRDAIRLESHAAPLPPREGPPIPDRFPESEAAAARFSTADGDETAARLRASLLKPLRARISKATRLLANLDGDRERLESLRSEGRYGELLKTALGRVRRGATEVVVHDFETGEPVTIPLDPALDAKSNLQRYFGGSKKAQRGLPRVEARRGEIARRIEALSAERARIEAAAFETLVAIARSAPSGSPHAGAGAGRKSATSAIDRISRRFVTASGAEVRVGKGARENDRLTFGGARGHDLWLHARGVPGAHVVLRLEKGAAPDQESLLDAAHLAAFYSDARGEPKVEVLYTQARYVKKTKGAPAGQVGVAHEKTMLLRVDPERLDRLLGRDPTARGAGS